MSKIMAVFVFSIISANLSFARVSSDLRSSDPNLVDDSLPKDQVSAVPFKGYYRQHQDALETQPDTARELYELSQALNNIWEHLNVQKQK